MVVVEERMGVDRQKGKCVGGEGRRWYCRGDKGGWEGGREETIPFD